MRSTWPTKVLVAAAVALAGVTSPSQAVADDVAGIWYAGVDLYDLERGKQVGKLADLPAIPSGVARDDRGRVYVLAGAELLTYAPARSMLPIARFRVSRGSTGIVGAYRSGIVIVSLDGLTVYSYDGKPRQRLRFPATGDSGASTRDGWIAVNSSPVRLYRVDNAGLHLRATFPFSALQLVFSGDGVLYGMVGTWPRFAVVRFGRDGARTRTLLPPTKDVIILPAVHGVIVARGDCPSSVATLDGPLVTIRFPRPMQVNDAALVGDRVVLAAESCPGNSAPHIQAGYLWVISSRGVRRFPVVATPERLVGLPAARQ
jgi:hypothetical protein